MVAADISNNRFVHFVAANAHAAALKRLERRRIRRVRRRDERRELRARLAAAEEEKANSRGGVVGGGEDVVAANVDKGGGGGAMRGAGTTGLLGEAQGAERLSTGECGPWIEVRHGKSRKGGTQDMAQDAAVQDAAVQSASLGAAEEKKTDYGSVAASVDRGGGGVGAEPGGGAFVYPLPFLRP